MSKDPEHDRLLRVILLASVAYLVVAIGYYRLHQ